MGSTESIPRLRDALLDKDISVCLAAAHSLIQLQENSGYDLYYDVLVVKRKGVKNLIAEQMSDLKTPERQLNLPLTRASALSLTGDTEWRLFARGKNETIRPTRAAAARELALDPDPRSSRALSKATSDTDWVCPRRRYPGHR